MKFVRKIFLIIFLIIILIYVTNITSIPKNIILFEGEELNLGTIFGIFQTKEPIITTSSSNNESNNIVYEEKIKLSLFNLVDVKDVNVTTIENTKVIPLGNTVGLKLYASGVLVIGMTEIEGQKPYENTGIKEGDLITYVDNTQITTTKELVEYISNSDGKVIALTYVRNGEEYVTNIEPAITANNEYKLGLWVRDGAAGIGTATYYEPSSKKFAALGHGIVDTDTENLISIESGELVTSTVVDIQKGEEGKPGQIKGIIANAETIGEVYTNTEFGLYGSVTNTSKLNINTENEIPVATRSEIKEGPAKMILCIENGIRKEYDIEITKIYRNNNSNNKSMLIKVTDEKLLELTGGIVQGMSGAPIVQNGKFCRSSNPCVRK
ncbi:MAG: SpoIVB peptidase [Clostridia bacterium]